MSTRVPTSNVDLPPGGELVVGQVLLVEDDAQDAFLVQELLRDAGDRVEITWVRELNEACAVVSDETVCVLLDLGLPDAQGLEALSRMIHAAPRAAVIVLTGLADQAKGAEAVGSGAEDYLVKGEVDGRLLGRSIRYAIARRRADDATSKLREAESLRRENARLERGLLPRPLLRDESIECASWYRAGAYRSLLSGDFFDAVELDDGTIRVIIGDVAGHGPDEAALGVQLRAAWRALVLAGLAPDKTFAALHQVLVAERSSPEIFVTACAYAIDPDRRTVEIGCAGHPAPMLLEPELTTFTDIASGPALGLFDTATWDTSIIQLGNRWSLMLYTDGLIEGRSGPRHERLGTEGLVHIVERHWKQRTSLNGYLTGIVQEAEQLHGGPLADDVAVLLLHRDENTP